MNIFFKYQITNWNLYWRFVYIEQQFFTEIWNNGIQFTLKNTSIAESRRR